MTITDKNDNPANLESIHISKSTITLLLNHLYFYLELVKGGVRRVRVIYKWAGKPLILTQHI